MPRTKVVCTIGPASRSPETLERLIRAEVARLNFSCGGRRRLVGVHTGGEHLLNLA
jgi:pyruvate kinase